MNNSFHARGKIEDLKNLRSKERKELKMLKQKAPLNIIAIFKLKLKYRRLKNECTNKLYLNAILS